MSHRSTLRRPWSPRSAKGVAIGGLATVIATAVVLAADTDQDDSGPGLADIAFMTGGWVADWQGNRLEEHFTTPHAGSMVGMFRWSDGDATNFTEHIAIEQRADGVHFFLRHFNPGSVPWEQEAHEPMAFRLASVADGRAEFVHPTIEFPARLIYHRTHTDRLTVRLEGHGEDGAPRSMEFNFRSLDMATTTEALNDAGLAMGYTGGLTLSFSVTDLTKAIDWYQNVLGFKLTYHLQDMGWCELSSGVDGVNIGLGQVEDVKLGGPTPTFGVADIEHARGRLESLGVRFDGETREIPGMVKLATFYDPDGNAMMLYQSLSDDMP